jgi:hypothetical protein
MAQVTVLCAPPPQRLKSLVKLSNLNCQNHTLGILQFLNRNRTFMSYTLALNR